MLKAMDGSPPGTRLSGEVVWTASSSAPALDTEANACFSRRHSHVMRNARRSRDVRQSDVCEVVAPADLGRAPKCLSPLLYP
jgi:hypothetical protein